LFFGPISGLWTGILLFPPGMAAYSFGVNGSGAPSLIKPVEVVCLPRLVLFRALSSAAGGTSVLELGSTVPVSNRPCIVHHGDLPRSFWDGLFPGPVQVAAAVFVSPFSFDSFSGRPLPRTVSRIPSAKGPVPTGPLNTCKNYEASSTVVCAPLFGAFFFLTFPPLGVGVGHSEGLVSFPTFFSQ